MKALILRTPAIIAAPFIALGMLVMGLLALAGYALMTVLGAVMALSFLETAFNLVGYLVSHNPAALRATAITGSYFVGSAVPLVWLGAALSSLASRRRRKAAGITLRRDEDFLG